MRIGADGVTVRVARREDLPALVGLFAADAIGGHGDSSDPEALPDYDAAFDWIERDPSNTLYVAELGGEVVGTFQTILGRALSSRGAASLTVVAVQTRQDLRGRGIGTAMMRHAIETGRAAGAYQVRLTSNAARLDAHRFYRRLGFEESHAGFRLLLGTS